MAKSVISYLQTAFWERFVNPKREASKPFGEKLFGELAAQKFVGDPDIKWAHYASAKRAPSEGTLKAIEKIRPGSYEFFTDGPEGLFVALRAYALLRDGYVAATKQERYELSTYKWVARQFYLRVSEYWAAKGFTKRNSVIRYTLDARESLRDVSSTMMEAFHEERQVCADIKQVGASSISFALSAALIESRFCQSHGTLMSVLPEAVYYFKMAWDIDPAMWMVHRDLLNTRTDLLYKQNALTQQLWPAARAAHDKQKDDEFLRRLDAYEKTFTGDDEALAWIDCVEANVFREFREQMHCYVNQEKERERQLERERLRRNAAAKDRRTAMRAAKKTSS